MRLIPVLTALVVMVVLYFVVAEREALLGFARGPAATDTAETAQTDHSTAEAPADATPVADATPETGIRVLVERSRAQSIGNAVLVRGETRADRQVEVRAETTARVISEPLRKGAFVEKGQLLCQLDIGTREAILVEARARLTEARARVPEAEAMLAEAAARLEEAQINDNAASKLSEGGFASDTRVAQTAALVRAAEAGIKSAEAGLETAQSGIESATAVVAAAQREIDNLTIEAPFSGLLESDTAEIGSLMQPGSLCATVIRLDPIKLVGFVPETELAKIELGAQAGARLATGQEVRGQVSFLSRSSDPTTRTFQVEIAVNNEDLSIRDGQTAEIVITSQGISAHKLPQSALTLNNEGQLGVRTVEPGNIVGFTPVSVVRDTLSGIWVSGLPPEADVIVTGQDFVTAGAPVMPSYKDDQS
ncbi:MAG: efflux RND transporter periplasmic adaptor subunit [Marinibacterium sp.]|nr:efflux RND transporter periplasmic adaptor subunit [Marinibacterium sp.]